MSNNSLSLPATASTFWMDEIICEQSWWVLWLIWEDKVTELTFYFTAGETETQSYFLLKLFPINEEAESSRDAFSYVWHSQISPFTRTSRFPYPGMIILGLCFLAFLFSLSNLKALIESLMKFQPNHILHWVKIYPGYTVMSHQLYLVLTTLCTNTIKWWFPILSAYCIYWGDLNTFQCQGPNLDQL